MNYELRRLGDVAEIVGGGTPSTKRSEFWDGEIPWLTPKDLSSFDGVYVERGARSITNEGLAASSARMLPPGSVLYTSRAPIGYVAIARNPIATNQGFKSFVLKEGYVPEYVFYLLKASKTEIESHASGGTFAEISAKAIADVMLPFPPFENQQAIASLLSSLDLKMEINRSVSKNLEALARNFFKSWFIDFDPVKAKMAGEAPVGMDAETAALFPGSMAHSALGSIPAGWEVASAGSTFDITIGRTPPRKETEWFCAGDTGVPWLSIRDMGTFGVFSGSTSEGLTHEAIARHRVPVVPEGTVLMSFKLTLGRICIASEQLATNEAIAHFVRTDKTPVDSWFTYLWLKAQDPENLESTSSIATATNSSFIRALPFLIPDAPVTEAFKSLVEPLFLQVLNLSKQNQALSSLRDTLLPRLISGELEIPDEMLAA